MSEIVVSAEILSRLESKLEGFAGQLDDEERNVLAVLLAMGAEQAAEVVHEAEEAEVAGFSLIRLELIGTLAPLAVRASGPDAYTVKHDVTVNKAKTADKAFNAMDGYVRG